MTAPAAVDSGHSELALSFGDEQTRPRILSWSAFALTVLLAFFGLIFSRISLDHTAFELERLEEKIVHEESRHWDLRLELARQQTPRRIADVAADMGLVLPGEVVSLDVELGQGRELDPEYRWAQLKTLLSAQP